MADKLVDRDHPIAEEQGNLRQQQGNDDKVEGRQEGRGYSVTTAGGRHPLAVASLLAGLGFWAASRRRK
jgi:hypothetical protein